MKRFWKAVDVRREEDGFRIALDGRPVRTPARAQLTVPTDALGEAIASEWRDQGETIDPRTMPLTGLANAAIDRVSADPGQFAAALAAYGESDLLYYRADHPARLVERQSESWDPVLAWARRRFDVDFVVGSGVMHLAQPEATVTRLRHEIDMLDPYRLAAFSPVVTIGGSLVAGLALLHGARSVDELWQAVTVDEHFQAEEWGADAEAQMALDLRERDFLSAARFLDLLA